MEIHYSIFQRICNLMRKDISQNFRIYNQILTHTLQRVGLEKGLRQTEGREK